MSNNVVFSDTIDKHKKIFVKAGLNMVNKAMKYITKSEDETTERARSLAKKLKPGDVICLEGNLGAGKTVFARALIRQLSGDENADVPSPTFTLLQTYDTQTGPLWHFDFYRIEDSEEIYELGWEEALAEGITLVEWPQRLAGLVPQDRLAVHITPLENEPNQREISFITYGSWKERSLS